MLTFVKTLAFSSSMSRDVSLVPVRSRKPGYEHLPICAVPAKHTANDNVPKLALVLDAPDRPGLLSTIFVVVKFEMLTIARVASPGSGKLEADVIGKRRVCVEKVSIWAQGGCSSKAMFRRMVVAGREAGIAEFWTFTLGKG
jgi:hypothetical protein